jgi:hypothetical protein
MLGQVYCNTTDAFEKTKISVRGSAHYQSSGSLECESDVEHTRSREDRKVQWRRPIGHPSSLLEKGAIPLLANPTGCFVLAICFIGGPTAPGDGR